MKNQKIRIVNTTPDDINIMGENGEVIKTYPKSKNPWAVYFRSELCEELSKNLGFPIYTTTRHSTYVLPSVKNGTYYVVTKQFAEVFNGLRPDLLIKKFSLIDKGGRLFQITGFERIK